MKRLQEVPFVTCVIVMDIFASCKFVNIVLNKYNALKYI